MFDRIPFAQSNSYIFKLVLIAILLKAGYLLMNGFPGWIDRQDLYERRVRWFESPETMYKANHLLCRNDCGFYEAIAEKGYERIDFINWKTWNEEELNVQLRYAFFPAMPVLVRSIMEVTGLPFVKAGNLFAFLVSIGMALTFFYFAKEFFGDKNLGFWAAVLLLIFPFHYYFSMIYTEALFLLVLLGCFIFIKRKKWLLVGILSTFIVLTRVNGIIMGLPFVIYFIENHITRENRSSLKSWLPILTFSIPMFAAFLALCWHMFSLTGEFLAFNAIQEMWDKRMSWPWESLFKKENWGDTVRSLYTIVFMLLAVVGAKKWPLSLNILIWINIILPLTAWSNISMPRYISVIFPFSLLFGYWMAKIKFKAPILLVLLVLHFVTFYFWIISDSFSY